MAKGPPNKHLDRLNRCIYPLPLQRSHKNDNMRETNRLRRALVGKTSLVFRGQTIKHHTMNDMDQGVENNF